MTMGSWVAVRIVTPRSLFSRRNRVEKLLRGRRVEVCARLVGEQEHGVRDDGAGDRHALLLAAGHLSRSAVGEVGKTERVECVYGALPAFTASDALQLHDELDVLQCRQHRDQVVGLEHEADFLQPQVG